MQLFHTATKPATTLLLCAASLFSGPSYSSLIDIGDGLVYDDVSDVTWISNGLLFSNEIRSTTANPTASPYTGPLLDTVVTPPLGDPHTVTAGDFFYRDNLDRWFGSWWVAATWADKLTYQYGDAILSSWRLPSTAEGQNLMLQIGAGNSGAVGPFTWVPPVFWTSDLTSATTANAVRPGSYGDVLNLNLMNGSAPQVSNIWAVTPGRVSEVPIPGAVWLFGSALAACSVRRVRKQSL